MDQRSICLFLAMKRLSAREVHNELVAVLGLDAIGSSTVTRYLRQRQFPVIFLEPSDEPPTTIINDAILETFDKQSFSSVRELAKLTCIPTTTVYRHLTKSLGFVLKHLRWVPHTLNWRHRCLAAPIGYAVSGGDGRGATELLAVRPYAKGGSLTEVLTAGSPLWTAMAKVMAVVSLALGLRFANGVGQPHGSLGPSYVLFDGTGLLKCPESGSHRAAAVRSLRRRRFTPVGRRERRRTFFPSPGL
jgi:hypothetical protein